ncbi:MAG TPA: M20/M25/M40 family metallo-hydrolase [Gemmatimonadales bacterium]
MAARPTAAQERVDSVMVERITREGLDRSQVIGLFNTLTNVIGPRLTGSPAYREAAEWARGRFEAWGLSGSRLEPFEFGRGWSLEHYTLELVEPRYSPLIGYPEAWTPSTAGVVEGAPVYLGDKTAEEIRAMAGRLRGAIVLPVPPQTEFITEDRPQPADHEERVRIGAPPFLRSEGRVPRRDLTGLLREVGAAAVVWPNQGKDGTVFVLGRRDTPDDATPSIVLAGEHYNMLLRLGESDKPVRVRLELRTRYHEEDRNGYNVLAELPGTDPALRDEVVMLGAHLDSWHASTGATDNADGSAEAMEAMRILKAVEARPRRTIRVALWGGEEQGLLGSRAWVARMTEGRKDGTPEGVAGQPTDRQERLYVYLNDDPGTGPVYGWYLEENEAIKPLFDAWLAPFRPLGARKNVLDKIGSTDHLSFIAAGVPAFNTLKDYVDYDVRTHHTNADFFERVRERDLQQSAIVLAAFAYHAAMRDGPLPAAATRPTIPEGDAR